MDRAYADETRRWLTRLRWDTQGIWKTVEDARLAGHLPGVVVLDDSNCVRAWAFYLLHGDTLQIGGVVASTEDETIMLLNAIFTSPEAACAERWMLFTYSEAPGLADLLTERGFDVDRYRYWQCPAPSVSHARSAFRRFVFEDIASVSALLGECYSRPDPTRPFAPNQRLEEFTEYLTRMVHTSACGTFDLEASLIDESSIGAINGAALVTMLAPDTAHLAQIVVRPGVQGHGLGRNLLNAAIVAAGRRGYRWMTLLVSEKNGPARRLYRRCGFSESAAFISAAKSRH